MSLSVIVSAYSSDRYHDLTDLLNGLDEQTCSSFETVIVIDKNKELFDKINQYIKIKGIKNTVQIFNHENRGLSHSRNIGIQNSKGSVVAFIDDDAVPSPNWVKSIIETFKEDEIGAVTGEVIPLWEFKEMSWFPKELFWMISCSFENISSPKMEVASGFGVNMAFKKKLILDLGMFNTDLGINGKKWQGGEDSDMFLRIREFGKKVVFNSETKVFHKVYAHRIYLKNILKRAFNGGLSIVFMKNMRAYDLTIENAYLKRLLLEFYPSQLNKLIFSPSTIPLKRMTIVSAVVIFEGLGYLYGIMSFYLKVGRFS